MTKNALSIRQINLTTETEIQSVVESVQEFMGEFRDPVKQCREAVEKSTQNGIVLEAVHHDQRAGIVVLIQMPFDEFQPRYHLAYIATKASVRGQGVGKKLLEEAVSVTDGDVSLHVGAKNEHAIEFYRRMHWKTVYLRMMPEKDKKQ